MNSCLNLYLLRQIATAFLFSGFAVTFVVLFTQSFRLLAFVIDNAGTLLVFAKLMGLMIPTFLPLIVPISLGVAVLFIYHKLAIDSELVVMRGAGISPESLAKPAMIMAVAAVFLGYGLTFWVTPAANRTLVQTQYKIRDNYSAFMVRPGAFNDLTEGLTFFARRRLPGGGMQDILVHDVRHPDRPVTIMARSGQVTATNGEPQITVFNGKRQELDVQTGHLQQLDFDRYVVDLHFLKSNKLDRVPDPRELSFGKLIDAALDKTVEIKGRNRLGGEIHQRLGGPLLALTFAAIGVTVILAGDFNRRGMARRVVIAAVSIVIIQAAMLGLVNQVDKYPWLFPVLYIVILSPLPFCWSLLRGSRRTTWLMDKIKRAPWLTRWA